MSAITGEEFEAAFDAILVETNSDTLVARILATPGVIEILREEWNNEIIERAELIREGDE